MKQRLEVKVSAGGLAWMGARGADREVYVQHELQAAAEREGLLPGWRVVARVASPSSQDWTFVVEGELNPCFEEVED